MLKQMRDQMERINFKEIQLFDSIIAQMSDKNNAASTKLIAKLKEQDETIRTLVAEAILNRAKVEDLTSLVSSLIVDKEKADAGLNKGKLFN